MFKRLVALCLLAVLCVAVAACSGPGATPTALPTVTSLPTSTMAPTSTAAPTIAALPTDTSIPTAAPSATTQPPTDTSVPLSTDTSLPVPSDTPLPVPTEVPTEVPTVAAVSIQSGGLGLTKEEWETRFGPGESYSGTIWYRNDHLLPQFDDSNHVFMIYGQYPDDAPVPLSTAEAEALPMLPRDAVRTKKYDDNSMGDPIFAVYVYTSKSIVGLFDPSSYIGAPEGTIELSFGKYQDNGYQVGDFAISLGEPAP